MLRWTLPLLAAALVAEPAAAADALITKPAVRAARQLPPGLPRPHYKYRTTIAPPTYRREVVVEVEEPGLFTPSSAVIPYIAPVVRTPLLPGSAALPGYYGRPFDYEYQGPYYGGPQVPYWNRLPYACGIYGYC